jgi:hypothetical protein
MGVMMSRVKKLGVFFVSSMMVGAPITLSLAQGAPAGFMYHYAAKHQDAGGRMCAGLTWHVNRMLQPDKTVTLTGPFWYEDGSGTSFGQGIQQANGDFTMTVKLMTGEGPTGTVTGKRKPDGSVDATVVGSPCFAGTYHLAPGQTQSETKM